LILNEEEWPAMVVDRGLNGTYRINAQPADRIECKFNIKRRRA